MQAMMEQLEGRRLYDAQIGGGVGHSSLAVDVHRIENGTDTIIGVLKSEFFAEGFMGATNPTSGDYYNATLGGAQGMVRFTWLPNTTIAARAGQGDVDIPTYTIEDMMILGWMWASVGINSYGPNAVNYEWMSNPVWLSLFSADHEGADFASEYWALGNNCHTYVDYILGSLAGDTMENQVTKAGLMMDTAIYYGPRIGINSTPGTTQYLVDCYNFGQQWA